MRVSLADSIRVLFICASITILPGCGGGGISGTANPNTSVDLSPAAKAALDAGNPASTAAVSTTSNTSPALAEPAISISSQSRNELSPGGAVHIQEMEPGRMLPPISRPRIGQPTVNSLAPMGNVGALVSIVVTPAMPSVLLGQTQQFTATGYYSSGFYADLTNSVVWWSAAQGVATINSAGLATTVSAGTTSITATYVAESPLVSPGAAPGTPVGIAPNGLTVGSTNLTSTAPLASLNDSSLTFGPQFQGTTSTAQTVTLRNMGTAALNIASIAVTGTNSGDFGSNNNCGSSLAPAGFCTINVTFTPTAPGLRSAGVVITDNNNEVSGSTQTVNLTGNGFYDVAPVNVSLDLTGDSANNITTTVTVCVPGTTNCTTIPNVLVDTGSVGLRLLSSGADNVTGAQVGSLGLQTITDTSTGYPVWECVDFGNLAYTWGPMAMATVTVGGETATQIPGGAANSGIPIQIVTTNTPPEGIVYEGAAYYNPCIYENVSGGIEPTNGLNAGSVANLGSNGILGIGNFPQDCVLGVTNYCTSLSTTTGQYLEYDSSGISTTAGTLYYVIETTPLDYQAWNPVSAFLTDSNGSILSLPSVSASGSAPVAGTLTFGIGTETNNAISTQTVYELDADGNFNSAEYNGVTYTSSNSGGSFLDSSSSALYVSDETTLGTSNGVTIQDCIVNGSDIGYYCPIAGTTPEPFEMNTLTLTGYTASGTNNPSTDLSLVLGNYDTLTATGYAAFNNFAAPSCLGGSAAGCSTTTDFWDLGLPFFFGHPVYIGISEGVTYPNGYWAF